MSQSENPARSAATPSGLWLVVFPCETQRIKAATPRQAADEFVRTCEQDLELDHELLVVPNEAVQLFTFGLREARPDA